VRREPDFIIIGAMKCATSTLHEQLARQTGFFMTQPKEPNFFSDDDQFERGINWYCSLFEAAKPEVLCGESSTHYTKLPTYPRTAERMRAHFARVKLVYVMRHPIDRLVSHYIHDWTDHRIKASIDLLVEQNPELIQYGLYAMQIRPYLEVFGAESVLPVFFEGIAANPQQELERICAFLGYAGRPRWDHTLRPRNVSLERLRRSPLRDALVNLPLLRTVRRQVVPKSFRERVKRLWTMTERPQLSRKQREQLAAVFDEDLATLGTWLGVELSCTNFVRVATNGPHEWVQPPEANHL